MFEMYNTGSNQLNKFNAICLVIHAMDNCFLVSPSSDMDGFMCSVFNKVPNIDNAITGEESILSLSRSFCKFSFIVEKGHA